jgi:hypothetical protein
MGVSPLTAIAKTNPEIDHGIFSRKSEKPYEGSLAVSTSSKAARENDL